MDTPERIPTHEERVRKSKDIVIAINPTDEDFTVIWSAKQEPESWIIPNRNKDTGVGNGRRRVPRYIFDHYFTHFADAQLNKIKDQAIDDENAKLKEKGMEPMAIDGEARLRFETRYRIDNEEKRALILKEIWGGVAENYGADVPAAAESTTPREDKSLSEKLLDTLDNPTPIQTIDNAPTTSATYELNLNEVEAKKDELIKEVSGTAKGTSK